MFNSRDEIIDKIEKMLRVCDPKANATEAEVETAMAFAKSLMRKYEIEMAEVMASKGEELGLDAIAEEVVRQHSKTDKHELAILNAVCKITGTRAYTTTVWVDYKRKKQMVIFGHKDDVAVAHRMFAELICVVRAFARFKVSGKWSQQHYWYCNGFGQGLYEKAVQIERDQQNADKASAPSAGTTALIIRKQDLIEQYAVETLHLAPRKGRRGGSLAAMLSGEYAAGKQDGRQYDCGSNGKLADTPHQPKRLNG